MDRKNYIKELMSKGILPTLEMLKEIQEGKNIDDLNQEKKDVDTNVEIVFNYDKKPIKKNVNSFISFFKSRYSKLSNLLRDRAELVNVISINKIITKPVKEKVSFIGLVLDLQKTKNDNLIMKLEDPTGEIKVIIKKDKEGMEQVIENIVFDEVIGILGVKMQDVVFAEEVIFPDVPLTKEIKKASDDVSAVFISDIHIGSKMFLEKDFERFIRWLNLDYGTDDEKELAKKVKYLFIAGDLIDGIGIYPEQESELDIKDIYKQYEKSVELLSQIRKDIKIILSPGNHEAIRLTEPQPPLKNEFAKSLRQIPNLILVSNPAVVNIHKKQGFPGFDVLIYHGYSFDYYINNVNFLRQNGGYEAVDKMMSFLLQKRHLAPTHGSSLYIPDEEEDTLVISKVPDIFLTGHIHRTKVGTYNNIVLICGSCWQSKTKFQEKTGHEPEPSRVPIMNLQTRKIVILNFDKENDNIQ